MVKQIRVLFDSGSQRTFISERVTKILRLTSEKKENILLNTFPNSVFNILSRVDNENKSFEISTLCLLIIFLPFKKQPLNYVKKLPKFAE